MKKTHIIKGLSSEVKEVIDTLLNNGNYTVIINVFSLSGSICAVIVETLP